LTPQQYLTAAATRANMEETVLATGTIHPVEQVAIGAQVNGQIQSINVKRTHVSPRRWTAK
jgi:macrolide-specific efflux system membrane fusion protein